jgi:zinc transport system substrate-binding protein
MKQRIISVFIIFLLSLTTLSCHRKESVPAGNRAVRVVTTLFPLYDFAMNVGGNLVQVELLVPPGMEPHSFEPKPADIRHINSADIFICTGKVMEPWIEDVLKGVSNKDLLVVDTSTGIVLSEGGETYENHKGGRNSDTLGGKYSGARGKDPHIWLDFANAQTMVENILNGYITKDPANRHIYLKNAEAYGSQLDLLDKRYRDELATCRKDTIVHGGHFAFGYLARRYQLRYLSAYRGFSSNTEPTPGDIMKLIQNLREHHLNYIFFEELVSPTVAETIARETGAKLLILHGAHNISKDEWDKHVTFLSLMEDNLKNLKTGLECH